jgi:serine/threonine-protein kinase HipA
MILRQARVYKAGVLAGVLQELEDRKFRFEYLTDYQGPAISLSMPIQQREWSFGRFPPFFDGLLPEGLQLQALQLIAVGEDLVGDVTVEPL